MARPQVRIAVVQFGFALGVVGILARAAQLQIFAGRPLGRTGPAPADRAGQCFRPAAALCTTATAFPSP